MTHIPATKTELAFIIIDRFMPCIEVFAYLLIGAALFYIGSRVGGKQ